MSEQRRTKSEVLAARRTPAGCCSDHADYRPCDCLENAVDDATDAKGGPETLDSRHPQHCPECQGRGWVRDHVPYATLDKCDMCGGSGMVLDEVYPGDETYAGCPKCEGGRR